MTKFQDRWALVTGASSGLGAEFARQLAVEGAHLVLVARREDRLQGLADQLSREHGVKTRVVALDLSLPESPESLHRQLAEEGLEIDVLVNNAGFGVFGGFLEIDWERERRMLELDIVALTDLTKRFARDMNSRGRGWILQVASIGAYQPSPTYASYAAAKAYVLNFSEALAYELESTGVVVTVVSPGVTETEFFDVAGQKPTLYQRMMMMKSEAVVRKALEALHRGRRSLIPGLGNAVVVWSLRFLPRRLITAVAARAMTLG